MPILDDVRSALTDAGHQLKADLWKPGDADFLQARAKDLVGLAGKAEKESNAGKKAAYLAAARDTVTSVKLLALIRAGAAEHHLLEALGKFFTSIVIPAVLRLLPPLVGL